LQLEDIVDKLKGRWIEINRGREGEGERKGGREEGREKGREQERNGAREQEGLYNGQHHTKVASRNTIETPVPIKECVNTRN
jgi:hypothetical protein